MPFTPALSVGMCSSPGPSNARHWGYVPDDGRIPNPQLQCPLCNAWYAKRLEECPYCSEVSQETFPTKHHTYGGHAWHNLGEALDHL
jgi:hypothetical protein